MTRFLLLLALMCENVNAAPQVTVAESDPKQSTRPDQPVAAPFIIAHPMCQTGFTIAMRYDDRNVAGTITKSVWVRKCVRAPRIVYGRKV